MIYTDRTEAGKALGAALKAYADRDDVIVLAIPRGGVPVAAEIARALKAPLDVIVARKLGAPYQPELAVGAVAEGGGYVLNPNILEMLGLEAADLQPEVRRQLGELERRKEAYRSGRSLPSLQGRVVILVDDGLATGATMRAAVHVARLQEAARVVVAVPVGAARTCQELAREADEVVCLRTPEPFYAIGSFYWDFAQLSDGDVVALLEASSLVADR